jgi:hypothetical protein
MPPAQRTAVFSLALSIGLVVVAALLAAWLWLDRRHRGTDLSEQDATHFARQDFRRAIVALILVILAVGIFVGSRISHKIDGRANPLFLQIWYGVFVLLIVLVTLAVLDWIATRLYARRHFRELARERLEILREQMRQQAYRSSQRNGSSESYGEQGSEHP